MIFMVGLASADARFTNKEPETTKVKTTTPAQKPAQPAPAPEKPKVDQTPAPAPKVAQAAPAAPIAGGCEQYRPIVAKYGWDVRTAMAVMQQESTMNGIPCNNMAANLNDNHMSWAGCMGSFGLFQINCSHGRLYDPEANIATAYKMYQASGWSPWSAYTSGAYRKYLR